MLGFLKTIFRGRNATPQGNAGLAIPRTVYTAVPRPVATPRATVPAPPSPQPIAPAPAPDSNDDSGGDIDISLQSVLRGLPDDLKDRVRDLDIRGATMTISLERILSQLPSGSVRISFGSLRQAAPQLFSAGAEFDSRDVALPLDEIKAKINPALICRLQEQATNRFNEEQKADILTPAQPELETPQRASSLAVPPVSAPDEMASPTPANSEAEGVLQPFPAAPIPNATREATPDKPVSVPTPQPANPAQSTSSISVDLALLVNSWPETLRQEIARWNLPDAKIALPADTVREAMKRGRVSFTWQTLRSWIAPEPPAQPSAHDSDMLDLPLPVIAPLFLAGQKQSARRVPAEQQSTREEIPDLFFDARKTDPSNGKSGEATTTVAPKPDVLEYNNAFAAVAPNPAASKPESDQAVMRIPLKELTQLWPENVRTEVSHWNLDQLMVALPADRINAALKQGKVVFAWENLRCWILPAPPTSTALQDRALLELPLPVIMPLFLAARKQSSKIVQRPQPQIADDIPDPFADFLPSRTASPSPAETPMVATVAKAPSETQFRRKPAATPVPTQKSSGTNFVTREQTPAPVSSNFDAQPAAFNPAPASHSTPAEVLATALGLEGVAGALIALADGFKVASKLPPGVDGDTVAAFLPHIFSKVNQSTRELRMGELNNLNFTVDNVPWKIFRVNQIFFAALGQAGKPMPTDQLSDLAHKLTFKN